MATKSNLLNEVIADAKQLKETAKLAAINTLKETFTPTVNRLISQKLSEDDDIDDLEDEAPAEEPVDDLDFEDSRAPAPEPEDEDDVDLDEILRELDGEDTDEDPIDEDDEMADEDEEITTEDLDALIEELEDDLGDDEDSLDEGDNPEAEEEEDDEPVTEKRKVKGNTILEVKKLKRQLHEAYKVITMQKASINEVNLLNTKMIYMTKITNSIKLSEKGKLKIVETFDRAKTVREIKLIYATICENFQADKKVVKPATRKVAPAKRKVAPRRLSESASRTTKTIKPLNEGTYDFSSRWKQLAGI